MISLAERAKTILLVVWEMHVLNEYWGLLDFCFLYIPKIKCSKLHVALGTNYFLRDTKLHEAFYYKQTIKYVSYVFWLDIIIQKESIFL